MCRLLREEPLVYFYKIIILKYRWNVEKGRKKEGRKEGRKESFLLDDREDIEIDRWSKLAIFQGCTIAKPWPSPELSSRKGQMWQTFTSYLHLPRLRPCFPDRVCSANGIERGRLSFFASSSAHASVIYFSLSSFSKDFTIRKLRNRITLSRNEGIPPSHIFISLLRDHSTVRVLSSLEWKGLF